MRVFISRKSYLRAPCANNSIRGIIKKKNKSLILFESYKWEKYLTLNKRADTFSELLTTRKIIGPEPIAYTLKYRNTITGICYNIYIFFVIISLLLY